MRWKSARRSQNIEDRRGGRARRTATVGGGVVVIALLASLIFGGDPQDLINLLGNAGGTGGSITQSQPGPSSSPEEDELVQFVSAVLASTEDAWGSVFRSSRKTYVPPTLVLYRDSTPSACGTGSAASGPFYCPADQKVYLDLSFLEQLRRMGATGDFAFAYVIAHEVGHHVQTLLGTEREVRRAQQQSNQTTANRLSVQLELQADCYAGIWGYETRNTGVTLEPGDVEEGMEAAAAVGDDAISRGRLHPDAFTHGSSQQRMQWLRAGLRNGDPQNCDTFR